MGAYDQSENRVQHHFFPHRDGDGFTAFIKLLEAHGWDVGNLQIPAFPKQPSWFEKLFSLLRYPFWAKAKPTPWRSFDDRQKSCIHQFIILPHHESEKIIQLIKDHGVSVTSYLLWHLHQVLVRALVEPSLDCNGDTTLTWWLPVDMRPFLACGPLMGNFTSNIACPISQRQSLEDVTRSIRNRLRRWDYWGAWKWMQIGRSIGINGMRKILIQQIKTERWMGTFTYLGQWPLRGMNRPVGGSDLIYFGSPQATTSHPIAAGAGFWNGQMVLTITAMACLPLNEQKVLELTELWRQAICSSPSR